jgi:hypothetical protein
LILVVASECDARTDTVLEVVRDVRVFWCERLTKEMIDGIIGEDTPEIRLAVEDIAQSIMHIYDGIFVSMQVDQHEGGFEKVLSNAGDIVATQLTTKLNELLNK